MTIDELRSEESAAHPPGLRPLPRLVSQCRARRVQLIAVAVTAPLYALWATLLATGGGDLAAQIAWARFASQHADSAYNLSWYGGMHTANYSLVAPQLMAVLGVRTVSVVSGLASSWLAGALFVRTGVRRPLWPALLAALALWCDVVSGRTTFALGTAFALAACLVLTGGARRLFAGAVLAALATAASPVAGLFLVVAGAGWLLAKDRARAMAVVLPPVVVVGLTTLLFPFQGEQPMAADRIWQPFLLAAAVVVLAPRTWRVVRHGSAVYAVGVVLTYLIPSPVGTNVERLAELVAPAVLLACLLEQDVLDDFRHGIRGIRGMSPPRRVLGAALIIAVGLSVNWVTSKTVDDIKVSTTVPAWASHTRGVVRELGRLGADRTRVEVVPARNHREAAILAAHVNTARGWNRQLDVERGRLFYEGTLTPSAYRGWLDHWAVGYVVLPHGRPDGPAEQEAALVAARPAWLHAVWHDARWTVYRVAAATPLVSGGAEVVRSDASEIVVRARHRGTVTVRVVYSRWLHADGGACLREAGEWTRLTVPGAGDYRVSSEYRPPWKSGGC